MTPVDNQEKVEEDLEYGAAAADASGVCLDTDAGNEEEQEKKKPAGDKRKKLAHVQDDDDDQGHNNNNKTTTTATGTCSNTKKKKPREKRNRAVLCIRRFLAAVLVLSAIAVSVAVYSYISSQEEREFTAQFQSDAQKLLHDIGTNFDLTMGAADAFMLRAVAHARSTKATWPMVPPVPDLAVQSAKLMSQKKSIYMAFYPLITRQTRDAWENFTRHNDDWVNEALQVQAKNPNFHVHVIQGYNYTRSYSIWRNEGPEPPDAEGPFLPSWMGSPVIPSIYYIFNWNALAYQAFAKGLLYTMESKSVVVTAVANHADPNDPVAVAQAAVTSDWAIPYMDKSEDTREPFSDMYYPVINDIENVVMKTDGPNITALGSVAFSFYWRHCLENICHHNRQVSLSSLRIHVEINTLPIRSMGSFHTFWASAICMMKPLDSQVLRSHHPWRT